MRRRQKPVPKGIYTAQIEKYSHDGRGIARIDGKTTFIHGALPNETVEFSYTRVARDFAEGKVHNVLSASSSRVEPKCDHYQLCGGCSLQHLNEDEQIQEKQSILLDLFQRIAHIQPENVLPPLRANSWAYRNKARLSARFVEKKQSSVIGFRERDNGRFITEINSCAILNAAVSARIPELRSLINQMDNVHSIAQIEVSAGDNEVALIIRHLEPMTDNDLELWRAFGQASSFRLYLQPKGPDSITLFYPERAEEYLNYHLPDEGIEFLFHPTDFTQVNAALNQLMIASAMDLMDIQPDDIVMDLFCGLGNFSLPMAKRAKTVIGVEGSEAMVERASMNARHNNLNNAFFYCRDLDKIDALAKLIDKPFNKLLIDPPRSGALEIVKQIEGIDPQRIVYVSCNPATLARDADILVNQKNYRLKAAGVMDMFAHTTHVESIALFEKE